VGVGMGRGVVVCVGCGSGWWGGVCISILGQHCPSFVHVVGIERKLVCPIVFGYKVNKVFEKMVGLEGGQGSNNNKLLFCTGESDVYSAPVPQQLTNMLSWVRAN